jgi:hypothetical protein
LRRYFAILSTVAVLAFSALFFFGFASPPTTWWYPFISSFFSDYYTTGPFAMTSNTREDNPVWAQIPTLNKTQARMTYAMTRGKPRARVAWLFAEAEWPDSPGAIGGVPDPNSRELPLSKALAAAGYGYDRISRSNLGSAKAAGGELEVGEGRYQALLISDLNAVSPELLTNIASLAEQGIEVLWHGSMPERARGWADNMRRDQRVREQVESLSSLVTYVALEKLGETLRLLGIDPALSPADGRTMQFRSQRRVLESGELVLLFNEQDRPVKQGLTPSMDFRRAVFLNPETGAARDLTQGPRGELVIDIPARRTRLLYLHRPATRTVGENAPGAGDEFTWDFATWRNPPRAMHPQIRWWWPGNAVTRGELLAELNSIYQAGFGSVELQTLTIGLTEGHLRRHQSSIYQVGSAAYLAHVKAIMAEAERLGMTVDLTLGSGWSSGGPFIDQYPEQQLLRSRVDVVGPMALDAPLPPAQEPTYVMPTNWVIKDTIGAFDSNVRLQAVVAAQIDTGTSPPTLSGFVDITEFVSGNRIKWQVPAGEYRLMAFYQNNSAHNVAASAYTGGLDLSPVVDHLDPGGVREYIEKLGKPWLEALLPYKPDAVFVDSFELIGELPWSSVFFEAFQSMHSYDIKPYLPLLFRHLGESKYVNVVVAPKPAYQAVAGQAQRIREDYEQTRAHLFQQDFLGGLKRWTMQRGVKLRLQAHGGYGDYLDSYQIADIPEAEGLFASGSYDFLKLASSAGHIAGRRFITSESFIMLTLDFNALTIDDYYFLIGNAFAAGVNRTVCHGYAYHYLPDL